MCFLACDPEVRKEELKDCFFCGQPLNFDGKKWRCFNPECSSFKKTLAKKRRSLKRKDKPFKKP
jgi:hypothetical protein